MVYRTSRTFQNFRISWPTSLTIGKHRIRHLLLLIILNHIISGSEKSYNCLYVFLFVLIFLWPLTLLIWATIHVNIYLDSYSDVHLIKNHHFNKNAGIVILSGIIYFIVISIAWLEGKSFDVRGSLLLFPRKLQTSPRGKSGKVATWELCK